MITIMQAKVAIVFALMAVAALASPVPDQKADEQFFYTYGYGYPYAAAAYHVPVVPAVKTVGTPAATAKVVAQPAVAYTYPAFGAYPYYGYPYVL